APRPSITVSRTKPGLSGSKNSVRRPAAAGNGMPVTSTVNGPGPPVTLSAIGSGLPAPPRASPSRPGVGGNKVGGVGLGAPPATIPARKRGSGGGSFPAAATSAPLGAAGSGTGSLPVRAKASNRIGAAATRPTRPGTGAPSGRPTQTPMVRLPSKPTAQASRYP